MWRSKRDLVLLPWPKNRRKKKVLLLFSSILTKRVSADEDGMLGRMQGWEFHIVCVTEEQSSNFYRLRSPGIDSKESIPPAYVARRAGTTNSDIVAVACEFLSNLWD